jgi:hypothetical protein
MILVWSVVHFRINTHHQIVHTDAEKDLIASELQKGQSNHYIILSVLMLLMVMARQMTEADLVLVYLWVLNTDVNGIWIIN